MAISFPPNSRYANCPQTTYVAPDGRIIAYLVPRYMPPPERFKALTTHRVVANERVDLLAERYYGDSEQYWRLCDANRFFWPPDTTAVANALLLVPLPLEMGSRGES